MYPDWVEKQHVKGTSVKESNGRYYLYKMTSKYVAGKKYPVSVKIYLGRITENGLVEPTKVAFTPGVDSAMFLTDKFKLKDCPPADASVLSTVLVVCIGKKCFLGKLTKEQEKIMEKHFILDNCEVKGYK